MINQKAVLSSNHHPSLFDIPPLKKPSGRCSPAAQSRATHPGEERVKFKSSGRPAGKGKGERYRDADKRAGTSAGQALLDPGAPRHWPLFPRHSLVAELEVSSKGQTRGRCR